MSSWQVGRPETLRWPGLDSCRPRGLWRAVPAQGRLGKAWGGGQMSWLARALCLFLFPLTPGREWTPCSIHP